MTNDESRMTYEWIKEYPRRSTRRLADDLKYSVPKMRGILRILKKKDLIDWTADWYGQNCGYRRLWTALKAKQKRARVQARKVVAGYE